MRAFRNSRHIGLFKITSLPVGKVAPRSSNNLKYKAVKRGPGTDLINFCLAKQGPGFMVWQGETQSEKVKNKILS